MTHAVRGFGLAATLVLIFTGAVFSQASTASTSSTAAYVYVQIQGAEGAVYGFRASSSGQLSAISGSPFKPSGQIIGSNKYQFFTLGKDLLHSYGIASDGAIQSQLSQTSIFDYAGSVCGGGSTGENGAVLDHTGKYIYVMLDDGFRDNVSCGAYQTYIVDSDGAFSFDGDTEIRGPLATGSSYYDFGLPSVLGSETFAYSEFLYGGGPDNSALSGFRRESSGALQYTPDLHLTTPQVAGGYMPASPDASPVGNYVVLQLYPDDIAPPQLGSFTVDSQGNLSTNNASSNMPASAMIAPFTTFSPSGDLFVAYADNGGANGKGGIEIYKFNGAAPLTLYKTLLDGTGINQAAWDGSNHLYAISTSENKLYVFTVTATSVAETASISIGSPFKMVVVSGSEAVTGSATQFESPLLGVQNANTAVDGEVTIDTSGNTTVKITGQAASKTYTLQFCPATASSNRGPACFNVTTVTTDSSGSASSTVRFPQSGNWAGDFSLNDSGGNEIVETGLFPGVANETYFSTLLPESKTNGGAVAIFKGQNPLTSGSVSYTGGAVLVTVKGAAPDTGYQMDQTSGTDLDSSNSYALGTLNTDAAGNGSKSVQLMPSGGDMFNMEGGAGAGFVGGFSIP
jgi:hypothetical protein